MYISVTVIVPDRVYEKKLSTRVGILTLTIKLGRAFPSEEPIITVEPLVNHEWVDTTGKIKLHALGLSNVIKHSILFKIFNLKLISCVVFYSTLYSDHVYTR